MKTLVCIPCMDSVPTMFMESLLRLSLPPDHDWAISRSSLIYDSRNNLSKMAVVGGFKRIVWIDSDMTFGADLIYRLHSALDRGLEVVSGLYFTRKMPVIPVLCEEIGYKPVNAPSQNTGYRPADVPSQETGYKPVNGGSNATPGGASSDGSNTSDDTNTTPSDGISSTCVSYTGTATTYIPYATPVSQYEPNSTFEVAAMGMGACMMDISVIERVNAAFGLPFSPEAGFGEDYSFCMRCSKLGIKLWCDSSIKLGHISQTVVDEDVWISHRDKKQ